MTSENINKILGINESYEMPDILMNILLDDERKNDVFDQFMNLGESLDHDWFTEYFQTEQGDRNKLNSLSERINGSRKNWTTKLLFTRRY